jgi:hypothetical protein
MKKLSLLVMLFVAAQLLFGQNEYKRYGIKSGKVVYKTTSEEGIGTKTLLFDDYGMKERLRETISKNNHVVKDNVTILNGERAYSVDLLTNEAVDISESFQMANAMAGNDMAARGKDILEAMGGKMTGHADILGKHCEQWEMNTMGKTVLLIYKAIPLSTKVTVMSFTSTEEAVSFKEGISTSASDFELPAGVEITNQGYNTGQNSGMTDEDKQHLEEMQKMTYEEFRAFVKKNDPEATDEEIKMVYKMMHVAAGGDKK